MLSRLTLAAATVMSVAAFNVAAFAQQQATPSDQEYMEKALEAGSNAVSKGASVVRPQPDGSMRLLREGANGFTCLIIRTDRMCADKNGMEFLHAIIRHKPPADQIGVVYMLAGDTGPNGELGGASNTDPYEGTKTPTNHWIVTGPHIMLYGPPSKTLGYTSLDLHGERIS